MGKKSAIEIIMEASDRIEKMAEAEGFEAESLEHLRWLYPGVPEATALLEAACSEMGALTGENHGLGDPVTAGEVSQLLLEGMEQSFTRLIHDSQSSLELIRREQRRREGCPEEEEELPTRLYQLPDPEDVRGNIQLYGSGAVLLAHGLELLTSDSHEIITLIEKAFLIGYMSGDVLEAPEPTGDLPETLLNTPLTWEPA